MRTCRQCGAGLTKKPGPGRWPHYCSDECRAAAAKVEPTRSECVECGDAIAGPRGKLYCSRSCRDKKLWRSEAFRDQARQGARGRYAPRKPVWFVECEFCGELACVRQSNARHCRKPECRLAHRAKVTAERRERDGREYYGYTEARAASYHRRRARKAGAEAEKFLHSEIYERDGWTCGICGDPVDPALEYPDRMSASLDHIVPLAEGGAHTRANTQCSHLTCNVRKGARVA